MTPQERLALALQYQKKLGDSLPSTPAENAARPVQAPTRTWLDDLSDIGSGYGYQKAQDLENLLQAAKHPLDTLHSMAVGVGKAMDNPVATAQSALQGAKDFASNAVSSPYNLGGAIASATSINPRKIAAALESPLTKNIYMPTRPKMPKEVGTRFSTTDLGGLAETKPFNIEDYKGASIGVMPWDNSSRNRLITSVSEENLKNPVTTHGGQQYALDIEHQAKGIAGASAPSIVKRIADRVDQARLENLEQGGSGVILQTPITMGEFSENYSVMPTQVLFNLVDQRNPSKTKIKEINQSIRSEFPDFQGIETESGRQQLISGGGGISAPGQLRKKFVDSMYTEGNEKYFGFNRQDISNAISDPSLRNVPRGYGGNVVISHGTEPLTLTPSKNITYPMDFSGQYVGGMGNIPIAQILPTQYANIMKEFESQPWNEARKIGAVIGALEKRKSNAFQFINDELINKIKEYQRRKND